MNEERKKDLRTQGRYSDVRKIKTHDKLGKSSPSNEEFSEKKFSKRYSNESKDSSHSFTDEDVSPVKYQENSNYYFDQLETLPKLIEIVECGKRILSTTKNGESIVWYEPEFIEKEEGYFFYDSLMSSINWHSKNIVINGEEKPQPRLVSWFGPYPYSYSGTTLEPAEMPDCVLKIKNKVENYLKKIGYDISFNSVLLNLYRNNKDSVAWHSDDESTMGIRPTIASVSLGELRRFEMKPKFRLSDIDRERKEYFVNLTHGSLIIMDGCMQEDWLHRVPKEYHDKNPRINLTFRTVYPLEKISHSGPFKKNQDHGKVSKKRSSYATNFKDGDFPLLKNDVDPSSHSNSIVKRNSLNSSSNSLESDLNKSSDYWDIETSITDKMNINDDNNDSTYDVFATNNVECNEAFTANSSNENSFGINPVEGQLGHPVLSLDKTTEYIDNKQSSKMFLNVSAKEFVPRNLLSSQTTPDYSKFSLEELLRYQVEIMSSETFANYAKHLKIKVYDRLDEFSLPIREDLEFMCNLSDGSQNEKNQKLISSRMVNIIKNNLPAQRCQPSSNTERSYYRHSRSSSYAKENHSGKIRSNQNSQRGSTYRRHS